MAEKKPAESTAVPQAMAPDIAARGKHALAGHVPYAPRCDQRIRGRAKHDPRRQKRPTTEETRPVPQMDYCFLKKATDGAQVTLNVLAMTDARTGCIDATAVRQKGVDRAAVD